MVRGAQCPPVRHKVFDSHSERADIGGVFGGDDRAHEYEAFEPLASLIERKLIEFRSILRLGATHHQKSPWRARYCSVQRCEHIYEVALVCGVRNSTKKHTVNLTVPSAGPLGEREHPPSQKVEIHREKERADPGPVADTLYGV